MRNLNIAILGTWGKYERFASLINGCENCSVRKIWDPVYEKALNAAAVIGCDPVSDHLRILGDPEIHGVLIITENYLHADLVTQAAEAGKHIFLEKPLCTDLADAYKLSDAVKKSGVRFFMSDPFAGASTSLSRNLVQSGQIGRPLHMRIRMCDICACPDDITELKLRTEHAGGGMMSDSGGHVLHISDYMFGKPESVYAVFSYANNISGKCGREEFISMILRYHDGLTVSAECSTAAPGFTNGIEITGTKGIIIDKGTLMHGHDVSFKPASGTACKPFENTSADPSWHIFQEQDFPADPLPHIVYWCKMITDNISDEEFENDPEGTYGLSINKAVELMEIREAIYESALTGTEVKVK